MNAKPILLGAVVVLGAGALTFYLAGSGSAKNEVAVPTKAPSIVEPQVAKAELAPKEVVAAAPQAIAPPTVVAPGVKVYPNKFGDITYDQNTKTLTQNRKMLLRKGDGTVIEKEVLITATPKVSPIAPLKRQIKDTGAKKPRTEGKPEETGAAHTAPPADGDAPKKPFVK